MRGAPHARDEEHAMRGAPHARKAEHAMRGMKSGGMTGARQHAWTSAHAVQHAHFGCGAAHVDIGCAMGAFDSVWHGAFDRVWHGGI